MKPDVPLKTFGGKTYQADKIVALFPPHIHYVEPFFGGGAVLLARDPMDERLWVPPWKGVSELVNDTNSELITFWRVMQDPALFAQFCRKVEAIPLARQEWVDAATPATDPVDRAKNFFVRCRQSRAGSFDSFTTPVRTRTRRTMADPVSAWWTAVAGLPAIHERLKRVAIESTDGVGLIEREDTENTLYYLDQPYLPEVVATRNGYGPFTMTRDDHVRLLDVLDKVKGKVILSGYRSLLYDERLRDWNRHQHQTVLQTPGGKTKRRVEEILWTNF
jgi:DNA adenine methylase